MDIVERLQDYINNTDDCALRKEAADEIERLRNDLADALDVKSGAGPTALAMVIEDRDRLRAELAASQARIDALMLEYCPDEMTPEQVAEWGRNQRSGSEGDPK